MKKNSIIVKYCLKFKGLYFRIIIKQFKKFSHKISQIGIITVTQNSAKMITDFERKNYVQLQTVTT